MSGSPPRPGMIMVALAISAHALVASASPPDSRSLPGPPSPTNSPTVTPTTASPSLTSGLLLGGAQILAGFTGAAPGGLGASGNPKLGLLVGPATAGLAVGLVGRLRSPDGSLAASMLGAYVGVLELVIISSLVGWEVEDDTILTEDPTRSFPALWNEGPSPLLIAYLLLPSVTATLFWHMNLFQQRRRRSPSPVTAPPPAASSLGPAKAQRAPGQLTLALVDVRF